MRIRDGRKYELWMLVCVMMALTGCGTAMQLKKADRKYANEEWSSASDIYRKNKGKLSSKTDRKRKAEVNYKLAECYYKTNNHQKAARSYKSAIRYGCKDSTAYLHFAKSLLATGKQKEAVKNFEKYLETYPDNKEAQTGLESAQKADEMRRVSTRYVVSLAKEFSAKRGSDFCPMFVDEKCETLVFTSNRVKKRDKKLNSPITGVPQNNIYESRLNNSGKWEEPKLIEGELNTDEDEGVTTFSEDGKTMYFTHCEAKMPSAQSYQSNRSAGEWTKPTKIQLFEDTTVTSAHGAVTPDGKTMYFVSDAQGGMGGKDLWIATNEGGSWTVVENMGEDINTPGDEMFPYVRHDGVLFFSSNGHVGFGGLDIYMAEQDTSTGHWTVTNMMMPINSTGDDFGITFNKENDFGFFSSNRNQKRPIDKIYRFELPALVYAVEGKVKDDRGEDLGESTIRMVGDNGDIVKMRTKKDGSYRVNLELGTRYVMLASHRGYLNASYKFDTYGLEDSKTFMNDFSLVSVSRPIKMENVFYEFGKWTLTEESKKELEGLVKILQDNPNTAIELSAHTDMVGNEKRNEILSQKRAQSVVDFLIDAGIEEGRLTPVGYGESRPVVVSEEVANMYPEFLTAGDILTPEFVEALPKDQQEICNQINRRTEFKVTKTTYNLY